MKKRDKKLSETPQVETAPARIRMLVSMGTARRPYFAGDVIEVGPELSPETALNWIKCGVAETDKSLPGIPPETKGL